MFTKKQAEAAADAVQTLAGLVVAHVLMSQRNPEWAPTAARDVARDQLVQVLCGEEVDEEEETTTPS